MAGSQAWPVKPSECAALGPFTECVNLLQSRGRKQLPAEDGTGTCAMLKLKDWPPDSDFHLELVRHNQVSGRVVCLSAAQYCPQVVR